MRRLSEITARDLDHIPVRVRSLVPASDDARLGVAHMEINGDHPAIAVDGTDIVYYVLAGTGWYEVDGVRHDVCAGDALLIRAGTAYRYGGAMTYLNIQSPPITPAAVTWLDAAPTAEPST